MEVCRSRKYRANRRNCAKARKGARIARDVDHQVAGCIECCSAVIDKQVGASNGGVGCYDQNSGVGGKGLIACESTVGVREGSGCQCGKC